MVQEPLNKPGIKQTSGAENKFLRSSPKSKSANNFSVSFAIIYFLRKTEIISRHDWSNLPNAPLNRNLITLAVVGVEALIWINFVTPSIISPNLDIFFCIESNSIHE